MFYTGPAPQDKAGDIGDLIEQASQTTPHREDPVRRGLYPFGFRSYQLHRSRLACDREYHNPRRSRHVRDTDGGLAINLFAVLRRVPTPGRSPIRSIWRARGSRHGNVSLVRYADGYRLLSEASPPLWWRA